MRKSFLLLICLLFTLLVEAQIQGVSKVEKGTTLGTHKVAGQTYIWIEKIDSSVVFFYRDTQYQQLIEVRSFVIGGEKDLNDFYAILSNGLKAEKLEDISIRLKDDELIVKYVRSMGMENLQIYHYNHSGNLQGVMTWLTSKTLDKLFNKR